MWTSRPILKKALMLELLRSKKNTRKWPQMWTPLILKLLHSKTKSRKWSQMWTPWLILKKALMMDQLHLLKRMRLLLHPKWDNPGRKHGHVIVAFFAGRFSVIFLNT